MANLCGFADTGSATLKVCLISTVISNILYTILFRREERKDGFLPALLVVVVHVRYVKTWNPSVNNSCTKCWCFDSFWWKECRDSMSYIMFSLGVEEQRSSPVQRDCGLWLGAPPVWVYSSICHLFIICRHSTTCDIIFKQCVDQTSVWSNSQTIGPARTQHPPCPAEMFLLVALCKLSTLIEVTYSNCWPLGETHRNGGRSGITQLSPQIPTKSGTDPADFAPKLVKSTHTGYHPSPEGNGNVWPHNSCFNDDFAPRC